MGVAEHKRVTFREFLTKPAVRRVVLVISVVVIVATGAVTILTDREAMANRAWALHSYEIRHELSLLNVARAEARAVAFDPLLRSDSERKQALDEQVAAMRRIVAHLNELSRDNPRQLARLARIAPLVDQQAAQLNDCLVAKACANAAGSVLKEVQERQSELNNLIAAMDGEERQLLGGRLHTWNMLFQSSLIPIAVACAVALFLLFYSFRLLNAEVAARREMEQLALENAESYRALSARILELQDIERRKIARELHDSVGQFLAGLKMSLGQAAPRKVHVAEPDKWISETMELIDRAIGEIRTISHLLHPPLLDELGFEATTRWYAEEFAKRSGTQVTLHIDEIAQRLPKGVELALFRVLQESLTNVHRHAEAKSVNVHLWCKDDEVILEVADDGKGIPRRVLQQFQGGGAAGIGLSGMRERLVELRGTLVVESSESGTRVRATVPTKECETEDQKAYSVVSGL